MKVFEAVKLSSEAMSLLDKAGIKISDYRYFPLYQEYVSMIGSGHKRTYVVAHLSQKFGISERKTYYLVGKFSREIDMCKKLADE